jgi:hypothetical protein
VFALRARFVAFFILRKVINKYLKPTGLPPLNIKCRLCLTRSANASGFLFFLTPSKGVVTKWECQYQIQ